MQWMDIYEDGNFLGRILGEPQSTDAEILEEYKISVATSRMLQAETVPMEDNH